MGKRGSEWLSLRRGLAILQRLMRSPASGAELIAFVTETVGPEAYGENPHSAFKRDRENLRQHFGALWEYDASQNVYRLQDVGEAFLLDLADEQLQAIKLLSETFDSHEGEFVGVTKLLDAITQRLPISQRQALERQSRAVTVEVPLLDESPTPKRVWRIVQAAVREHRKLSFNYISPRHADQLPRYHEVAPYRIRFRQGHWYLYAYDLYRRDPHEGDEYDGGHKYFRLNYILEDERLVVQPTVLPVAQRRPPRYFVHYVLAPPVGRGEISQHFEDMTVVRHPDGAAEVKGYTDSEWDAVRTLLGYGENCTVLGGEEVLSLMRRRVQGLAGNYWPQHD